MLLFVERDDVLESVGSEPPLALALLGRRIPAVELGGEHLLSLGASAMQGDSAIRPDSVFPQPRAGASGSVKGNEDLSAFGCDLNAEARQGLVPVDHVLEGGLEPVYSARREAEGGHWRAAPKLQPGLQIGSTLQAALSLPVNQRPQFSSAAGRVSYQ